ncbi:MAG: hypothetical protein ACKVOU_09910 [Cytophagales bacterium]
MKNINYLVIILLIVCACAKQENSIAPKEIEKNLLTQTGTSLNDTIKNTTTTTGISTVTGCSSDSIYRDTVVHLDLATKQKLIGKWVETTSSFRQNSIDTLEFSSDSRFYIRTKRHFEDTAGNYNDGFMNTVYKTNTSESISLIKRPYGIRKFTGIIRKLSLRNDTLFGGMMDNYATADVRLYYYVKLKSRK